LFFAGVPFPKDFQATVKQILRRLVRVYMHIYCKHFSSSECFVPSRIVLLSKTLTPPLPTVCALSLEAHLNTSYRHFLLFVTEFKLIDPKELAPLAELNEAILTDS
jgi:MOB kinase activator 1